MSHRLQRWVPRASAAAALLAAALGLAACSGSAAPSRPLAAPAATPRATTTPQRPAPTPTLAPIPRDRPVAMVAGQAVSGASYADLVAQERAAAAVQAQQQGTSAPTEQQIRSQALQDAINTAVIAHYARQHGITATAQEVQRQYDTARAQTEQQARQAGQATAFTTVLRQYGFSVAGFKQALADGLIGQAVETRIAPPGLVDAVRARHILIGPPLAQTGSTTPTVKARPDAYYKATAMSIYQQLQKRPREFAALARQKSVDTASGAQGGELGWFVKGMMVPAFEQAAFALPVGRISRPVKSQYGYHIIQVEEHKKVPFTTLPQAALQTPQVQALAQQQQKQFQRWLAAERARDHVRVLDTVPTR